MKMFRPPKQNVYLKSLYLTIITGEYNFSRFFFSVKFVCTLKFKIKLQEKGLRENSNPIYIDTQNFAYDRFGINFIYISSHCSKEKFFLKPGETRRFREFQSSEVDQTCRQLQ